MGERQTSLFSHGKAKTPRGSAPALPPSSRIVPLRAALALLPLPMSPAHVGNAVFIKQFGIWLAWLNTSKTHFELRVASAQGWGWACPAAGKGNRMWMCHGMRCTPEDPQKDLRISVPATPQLWMAFGHLVAPGHVSSTRSAARWDGEVWEAKTRIPYEFSLQR